MKTAKCLNVAINGDRPFTIENYDGNRWRVRNAGKIIGELTRFGELEWKLTGAFDRDGVARDCTDAFGPFELYCDAVFFLAEGMGLNPELVQCGFWEAIENSFDMTDEQRAYWDSVKPASEVPS